MVECGLCGHTGPSVLQLGQLNEISESNINSSGTLMRTMRGNCLTKEGIMVLVWDRAALFTKVIGQRVFETVHHIKSLCSATLSSPALRATLDFFYHFDFQQQGHKENIHVESVLLVLNVHVCEWVKRLGHRGLID